MSKQIWIPELNTTGEEIKVVLTCNDPVRFLMAWDIKTLNKIRQMQIDEENYEVVTIIDQCIEAKDAIKGFGL